MYLSTPFSSSVNDYISKEEFDLRYITDNNAIAILGSLATMAKVNIKRALRHSPFEEENWNLLNLKRTESFTSLRDSHLAYAQFFLFNCLVDILHWIMTDIAWSL